MAIRRRQRSRGPHLTLLALALLIASLSAAIAAPTPVTVTLRQGTSGYYGCTDTFLDQYNPNYNYGESDEQFWVQKRTSHDRTALIKFDLTGQIPSGACIKSATLRLYQWEAYNFSGDDWLDVGVYRCKSNWQEGTGGDDGAIETGACWVYRTCNPYVGWSAAGARGVNTDRNDGTDDVERCTDGARWVEWDVTPSVQYWHGNPSRNYGLVLDWTAIGGHTLGGVNFRTSEWGSNRPELVITYVIPEAEPCVTLRLSDLSLNYWDSDPNITFYSNNGQLLCAGTTSDTAWAADGAATTYTLNSSFEAAVKVKLQQGIVGANRGQFGFGMYSPSAGKYIRLMAIGYGSEYYEVGGLCQGSGNGEYHDGSAYWASYWDDDYPTGPPSAAARFFSETPENEATTYVTYKIRYDKTNGMFYVFVNNVLVTYYSKVDMSNWVLGIVHENDYSGQATTVWTSFVDCTPPTPNPMTWAVGGSPSAAGTDRITMTASTATDADNPPVVYNFVETTGNPGGTSLEQSGTSYTDTGLSANTQYGYKVRARDSYETPNYTGYSSEVKKYTLMPNPTGINVTSVTATSAVLNAVDMFPNLLLGSSGVYFDADPDALGGINEWLKTTSDTANLTPNTQYTFKIKARNGDAVETAWAQTVRRTLAVLPGGSPYGPVTSTIVQANWSANGNPSGTQYYCEELTTGKNSGWTTGLNWALQKLQPETQYHFRVKARNADLVETDWCDLGIVRTTLTIGQIKSRFGIGDPVRMSYKVVTAYFPTENLIFIEDPLVFGKRDGSSGIGVRTLGPGLVFSPGDVVDVDGVLSLNAAPHDKEVIVETMMLRPVGRILEHNPPIGVGRDLGGEAFGCQEGVYNDVRLGPPSAATGLNFVGKLVSTTGKVRFGGFGGMQYIWVDDGSLLHDGAENGIRVDLTALGGMVFPPVTQYAVVTGVMRCMTVTSVEGKPCNVRVLWPRYPTDIQQYVIPIVP
ncbi:MAG: DNRLRE domain-containing protein [Armatimonadetes bacterium]|nr:DNRLRE domain-containing protein [Armatimonadota bacterium]